MAAFNWVIGLLQITALHKASGCQMSLFLCVKGESHLCREVAGNNRSHHPCQGLIWRQIFQQRWLPRPQWNGREHCLARSRRGRVAEKGANPTDDGLQGSRAPCGSEMIGRTDSNVASNRTFHCLLLLCLGLKQSWAFFAKKQVVSRCIPGLCHPFLLLKEKILQGLKYWFTSQTREETIHCIC